MKEPSPEVSAAVEQWTEELLGWALPEEILEAAPANPYAFPADVIRTATRDPRQTPTGAAITDVLAPGATILDVGCGAGRISAPFTDTYRVIGVEPRPNLAEVAAERGVEVLQGRWPDIAQQAGDAPVVLCTHVLYDVPDPAPFLTALHSAATRRVVLEVTRRHPWHRTTRFFKHFHDLDRPSGPTSELLSQVVSEVVGVTPQTREWMRPGPTYDDLGAVVAHYRQMLCLTADHDPEIERLLTEETTTTPDGRVALPGAPLATLWWDR